MKRFIAIAAAVTAVALTLASPPVEAEGTFELNVGSLAPKGTPWMRLLEKMEKQIETESGGKIQVILRPPGVMSEVEMVRETRKGERLQSAAVTTAALAEGGNVELLQLVELPYLFKSNKEADHILDNVVWDDLAGALKKRGFIMGIWSENGWRSFAVKGDTPIKKWEDLKGVKMRSQESDVHMAMYNHYEAQAVQKPMTEVLTALQSGIVDGLDNTALYLKTGGLSGPLDHFTHTRHIYQPAAIVFSRRWYESLPEDLQGIVSAPKSMAAEGRTAIREEDEAITMLLEEDLTIHTLTDAEREAFATKAREIHADFVKDIEGGPELLKKINDELATMR